MLSILDVTRCAILDGHLCFLSLVPLIIEIYLCGERWEPHSFLQPFADHAERPKPFDFFLHRQNQSEVKGKEYS
jgi:hypothetical protein